ncbi:MAG: hypothetical protein V3S97_09730 [Candidatus Bathyarchaeia archaeon]
MNRAKALIIEFNKTGFTNNKLKELKRGNWRLLLSSFTSEEALSKTLNPKENTVKPLIHLTAAEPKSSTTLKHRSN